MATDRNDNRNRDLPAWARLLTLDAGADLDSLQGPGIYAAETPINGPISNVDMFVTVLSQSIGGVHRMVQIANETENGRSYTRVRKDTGWSPWNWDNPLTQTEQLTADRIYYVRINGNDSNNGLTNTDSGAFATAQAAADAIQTLDMGRWGVYVDFETGGDYGPFVITSLKHGLTSRGDGGGQEVIQLRGYTAGGYDEGLVTGYKLGSIDITGIPDFTRIRIRGLEYGYNPTAIGMKISTCEYVEINNCYTTDVYGLGRYVDCADALCTGVHVDNAAMTNLGIAQGSTKLRVSGVVMDQVTAFSDAAFKLTNTGLRVPQIELQGNNTPNSSTGIQYAKTLITTPGEYRDNGSFTSASNGVISTSFGDTAPTTPGTRRFATHVIRGVIPGTLSNKAYRFPLPLSGGYRIVRTGMLLEAGTATGQLRAGNATDLGSSISLTTGYSNVQQNSIVGATGNQFLEIVLSSTAGASNLTYELEIEKIYSPGIL